MKHIQAVSSSISRLSYKPASSYGEAAARAKFEGAQFLLDELHEVCGRKFRIMDTSQETSRGGSRARDHEIIKASIIGIVGLIISFVVLKAGFEVLRDALGPIIGLPESKKLVDSIVSYASSFSPVEGVHDVIMDDFGPNKVIGSMRIEVPDDMEAWRIHELTREISSGIAEKFGISMTIGIYATNRAGMFANMRASLDRIVNENANIRQVHGFYCDAQNKICYFDLVIAFNVNGESIKASVVDALKKAYPAYSFDVEIDRSLED